MTLYFKINGVSTIEELSAFIKKLRTHCANGLLTHSKEVLASVACEYIDVSTCFDPVPEMYRKLINAHISPLHYAIEKVWNGYIGPNIPDRDSDIFCAEMDIDIARVSDGSIVFRTSDIPEWQGDILMNMKNIVNIKAIPFTAVFTEKILRVEDIKAKFFSLRGCELYRERPSIEARASLVFLEKATADMKKTFPGCTVKGYSPSPEFVEAVRELFDNVSKKAMDSYGSILPKITGDIIEDKDFYWR